MHFTAAAEIKGGSSKVSSIVSVFEEEFLFAALLSAEVLLDVVLGKSASRSVLPRTSVRVERTLPPPPLTHTQTIPRSPSF